tara:strand:+ start:13382 stop:14893 length:1512 start_codon:yes stop_codon:yes gene_type:complete
MDVSLGALRERLLDFRAWDSSGTAFNKRVREALNTALERMSGDVPEALIPDEEHVVLLPDYKGSSTAVAARLRTASGTLGTDDRTLEFTTEANAVLGDDPTWSPTIDGTWDGIYHIEIKDTDGVWHRRQCREFFQTGADETTSYFVTLDRPWVKTAHIKMDFRLHQPEFFVTDDIMRVLEPARIWDSTRQQVWAVDTAGASRMDMVDFQGETTGRPYRFWRGRYFQMPTPRRVPQTFRGNDVSWAGPWPQGKYRFRYTIVWGKKDTEWQLSPTGTEDPQFESAPSPISVAHDMSTSDNLGKSVLIQTENIDAMTHFDLAGSKREAHSGLRIRIYVALDEITSAPNPAYKPIETSGIFYLLTEIEPTATVSGRLATFSWDGSVQPDFYRPLRHSVGYYAYKVFPHQDARYELDFRVLRLPKPFIDDQDTAPIQRDSVSALLELALYYLCLIDGVDQQSAEIHFQRYNELAKRFRHRYASPGGIVEPTPIGGIARRRRYGTFTDG